MSDAAMGAVRVEATRPALRCALCHDQLTIEAAQACPGCATATHGDCRDEAGACPTLGCARAAMRVVVSPRPAPPATTRPVPGGDWFVARAGIGAAGLAFLAGLVAGLVATGGRTGLSGYSGPVVFLTYAAVGLLVAGGCRLLERWRRGAHARPTLLSWPYLPLGLAAGVGGWAVWALIVTIDAFKHGPFW